LHRACNSQAFEAQGGQLGSGSPLITRARPRSLLGCWVCFCGMGQGGRWMQCEWWMTGRSRVGAGERRVGGGGGARGAQQEAKACALAGLIGRRVLSTRGLLAPARHSVPPARAAQLLMLMLARAPLQCRGSLACVFAVPSEAVGRRSDLVCRQAAARQSPMDSVAQCSGVGGPLEARRGGRRGACCYMGPGGSGRRAVVCVKDCRLKASSLHRPPHRSHRLQRPRCQGRPPGAPWRLFTPLVACCRRPAPRPTPETLGRRGV
jgi:hypothetical protein